ncbi:Gfo/Idh/MocA family oxidoreductase [Mucilaginibacter arboris]|uniref:Oxidoreductase n=1 Tax=Mucilaginibacter arboris TaxID=2682090 RepID=A0A7K1SV55_9SPHI|nr:Gfo/Idh/MocA family oxidoreductase [Mucilaginibacter arboris]MVN21222.1 oxidoreductase [Mucilaginibacter arboris]
MDQPIKTGLLAFGMSGRIFHAPFLNANPGFSLEAVAERHTKKAAQFYPNIKSYDTLEEVINHPDLELVVVNTPNYTHFELAKQVLQAGKHVLIEKPIAATAAEAKALFDLGRAVNREVFVYQNRRWDSDFKAVKEVLEMNYLGKLIEVHFRYDRWRPEIGPKAFKEKPMPASGILYDLGPHLLDQVISLFGKPIAFSKNTGSFRHLTEVPDYTSVHLQYPENLNIFVTASLLVANPLPAFVIHGTRGSFIKKRADVQEAQLDKGMSPLDLAYGLEEPGMDGELTCIDPETETMEATKIPSMKGDFMAIFDAVYHSICEGKPFPVTEEDILTQLAIIE